MLDRKRKFKVLLLTGVMLSALIPTSHLFASEPKSWDGVDEAVVEKISKEHGREAKAPLLDPSGDLLLFAFLVAGAAGGFVAGYYWRQLTHKDR